MMHALLSSFFTRLLPASATHFMTVFLTALLQSFAKQLFMWFAVLLAALLFLSLTGMALMLGFLLGQFHWVLVGVPAGALLLLIGVWIRANQLTPPSQIHRRDAASGFAY
jgi:hypothetical protein